MIFSCTLWVANINGESVKWMNFDDVDDDDKDIITMMEEDKKEEDYGNDMNWQ